MWAAPAPLWRQGAQTGGPSRESRFEARTPRLAAARAGAPMPGSRRERLRLPFSVAAPVRPGGVTTPHLRGWARVPCVIARPPAGLRAGLSRGAPRPGAIGPVRERARCEAIPCSVAGRPGKKRALDRALRKSRNLTVQTPVTKQFSDSPCVTESEGRGNAVSRTPVQSKLSRRRLDHARRQLHVKVYHFSGDLVLGAAGVTVAAIRADDRCAA